MSPIQSRGSPFSHTELCLSSLISGESVSTPLTCQKKEKEKEPLDFSNLECPAPGLQILRLSRFAHLGLDSKFLPYLVGSWGWAWFLLGSWWCWSLGPSGLEGPFPGVWRSLFQFYYPENRIREEYKGVFMPPMACVPAISPALPSGLGTRNSGPQNKAQPG